MCPLKISFTDKKYLEKIDNLQKKISVTILVYYEIIKCYPKITHQQAETL